MDEKRAWINLAAKSKETRYDIVNRGNENVLEKSLNLFSIGENVNDLYECPAKSGL